MSRDFNSKIDQESSNINLLATNLRKLMHIHNIDPNDLSQQTGIALTTINGLKRGVGNPTFSTLSTLAKFFNISLTQLTEKDIDNNSQKNMVAFELPLLHLDELSDFLINKNKVKKFITTELDTLNPENYFAIQINNNAMSPLYEKGTIFIVLADDKIHDGDIVLVKFNNHPPCFRKIYIESDTYFFKPISDILDDIIIKGVNFNIYGIVTKAIQQFTDR